LTHLEIALDQTDQDLIGMHIRWNGHTVEKTVHYECYIELGSHPSSYTPLIQPTLRLEPWPWPGALAQDFAPRACWMVLHGLARGVPLKDKKPGYPIQRGCLA